MKKEKEFFGSAYIKLVKKYGERIYKSGDGVAVGTLSDSKNPDVLAEEFANIYYKSTRLPRWLQVEVDAQRVREARLGLERALEKERANAEEFDKKGDRS